MQSLEFARGSCSSVPEMETLSSRKTPVRRSVRYAIYALVAFCAAVVGVGIWYIKSGAFLFAGPAEVTQTSMPVAAAEAQQYLPFELPASARNVQYSLWSAWMGFDDRVRFEAPVDDCIATAKRIVERHNAENANQPDWRVPGIRKIDGESLKDLVDRAGIAWDPEPPANPTLWFHPETIKKALVAGDMGSHTPLIFIDAEHGVFYYRMTD